MGRPEPHEQLAGDGVPAAEGLGAPVPMYRPPSLVAHTSSSSRSSLISTLPSRITNENGGRSSSTQRQTRGSRRIAFPFAVLAPVVNTTVPSSSRSNQIGATWGRPSSRVVASFPVRGTLGQEGLPLVFGHLPHGRSLSPAGDQARPPLELPGRGHHRLGQPPARAGGPAGRPGRSRRRRHGAARPRRGPGR